MSGAGDLGLAGHERNPTGRFADRAADYVSARPSYPPEIIDAVLAGLGDPAAVRVADVGAGTGISSRLLAQRGCRVLAIEPNGAMRAAAAPHERVEWLDATGERTGLADASVDAVVCFQAFHWLRPSEALHEFARVLRPGGRVALVWNDRDEDDALTAEYGRILSRASGGVSEKIDERVPPDLAGTGLFVNEREVHARYEQRLSGEGLVARAMSASYTPKGGAAGERVVAELRALHAHHADRAGVVVMRYRTRAHLAERALKVSEYESARRADVPRPGPSDRS